MLYTPDKYLLSRVLIVTESANRDMPPLDPGTPYKAGSSMEMGGGSNPAHIQFQIPARKANSGGGGLGNRAKSSIHAL